MFSPFSHCPRRLTGLHITNRERNWGNAGSISRAEHIPSKPNSVSIQLYSLGSQLAEATAMKLVHAIILSRLMGILSRLMVRLNAPPEVESSAAIVVVLLRSRVRTFNHCYDYSC